MPPEMRISVYWRNGMDIPVMVCPNCGPLIGSRVVCGNCHAILSKPYTERTEMTKIRRLIRELEERERLEREMQEKAE